MSKNKQIDKILIALDSIKYNLELIKKSKLKNKKDALNNLYESIFFHLSVINKIIKTIFEVYYGK